MLRWNLGSPGDNGEFPEPRERDEEEPRERDEAEPGVNTGVRCPVTDGV
jgi:hypothetical protein